MRFWRENNDTLNKRETAILSAWNKISEYVKENYTGVFTNGVFFEWKHEVYYKIAFGVTKDGVAYIAKGSHGWAYDDYICHPNHEPPYFKNAVIGNAEEVIQDWQKIKGILESKANQEKNLYSFTV